jgi:two-component system chemotaxis response regulator CheY
MASILVIDDEAIVHNLIKDLLEYKGYTVYHAYNGEEGLAKIKEIMPDLVILDINMPRISGCAVSTIVHEDEKIRHIPILFLTGFIDHNEAEELGHQFSGQYLLTKPFDVNQLLELVEKITGQK